MTSWSLTRRLTRRVLLGVAAGWLISLAIGLFVIAHEMDELLDQALAEQAGMLLSVAGADADLPPLSGELAVRVLGQGGHDEAPWPDLVGDGHHEIAGWHVAKATDPASGLSVELGQSNAWRLHELFEGVRAFLVLMVILLVSLMLIVRRTAIQALRPARQFAANMETRDAADLSPMSAEGLPSELEPIPQALNAYLARIEALLSSERRFASDAAHELRTPIASARAQAQLLAEGKADADAPRRLSAALERLGQVVERLLQLSRAEADLRLAGKTADLVGVVRLLLEEPGLGQVRFDDHDIETAMIRMDPDLSAILLSNLLHNAVQHGNGPVRIELQPGPVIRVDNPVGEGADFHFERFEKGRQSPGTGLGLAVVRSIAAQNGLRTEFSIADGRARVTVNFTSLGWPAAGSGEPHADGSDPREIGEDQQTHGQ